MAPMSRFEETVQAAYSAPKGEGRRALGHLLRSARLEWNEEERKQLRRDNTEGFLLVPEGALVGVHLNLNKRPFFNVKQPRRPGQKSDFPSQTLGHIRALVLSKAWFYVGLTGSKKTAMGQASKTPYAGPVGKLTAVELPDGAGFGTVPKSGGTAVRFNPRDFPKMTGLFFCINGDVPVESASKVIMRDWKLWADGPKMMSAADIDDDLSKLGLTRGDVGSGGRVASFMRRRIPHVASYWDDPRFDSVRSGLIRLAYQHSELRPKLIPLLSPRRNP